MPDESSDSPLPLRQTCNRCRELKVRCQRSLLGDFPNYTCVRCSRAGAACIYSPQQRSGRPRLPKSSSNVAAGPTRTKKQRRRTSPIPTPPLPPAPSFLASNEPLATSSAALPTVWPDSWFSTDLGEFATGLDGDFELGEEPLIALPPLTPSWQADLGGTPMTLAESDQTGVGDRSWDGTTATWAKLSPPNSQFPDPNNTVKDIEELSELNLRIYRIVPVATAANLSGEMTAVTRSLIKVLTGVVEGGRNARAVGYALNTPADSPQSQREDRLRQHSIESSMYPQETWTSGSAVDTGTVLMILACYQRLFKLFKQVCFSAHVQVTRPAETTLDLCLMGVEPLPQKGNDTVNEDVPSTSSSSSQAVMTMELISHLLSRLDRGMRQLVGVLNFEYELSPTPRSSPAPLSYGAVAPQVLPGAFGWGRLGAGGPSEFWCQGASEAKRAQGTGSLESASCYQGAKIVIEVMAQKQLAIQAHIRAIKSCIEESDGI